MKKGQIYEGYVKRLDFPNKAVVEVEGEENAKVIVKGALPGQKISFVLSKKRSGTCEGRLVEVLENSPLEDIESPCEHFGKCGGCSYLNLSYDNQLKLKEEQVKRLIEDVADDIMWEGIKRGPKQFEYRNKMEFTFGDEYKGGPLALGMHKKGSFHDIVNLSDCRIVSKEINEIRIATVEYFAGIESVTFYNRMSHTGQLRHLVIRRSETSGEILINLVTTSGLGNNIVVKNDDVSGRDLVEDNLTEGDLPDGGNTSVDLQNDILKGYVDKILTLESGKKNVIGILHTINDSVADVVQADSLNILYGKDYFYEEILGLKFKITPFSFFQTNTLGASVLYETARNYVGETKDKVIFDLYSGTGTIAQMLAPVAKKVIGVEIVEEAVESAKENAKINGLDNCEFIAGDVLKVIDDVTEKPDFIVLDPPRDGINPKALSKIIAYGVEQIVYISCKPTSLARDLVVFKANGYEVVRGCCVDMFPGTGHVECVVLMSKVQK